MSLKKYYISVVLVLGGLIGFAQTPNSLLEDPSNTIKMKYKKITTKKNPKASVSAEDSNQLARVPIDCSNCAGLCDELTGECIEIIDPPPGGGSGSSSSAGRMVGDFNVSLSGAATYNVPINLPPGIKDIAPTLGLAFSSQASNGLAGWGWNVSGLSTITRVPSTEYHDGIVDGVDFDSYDRFALDGQRLLIKSGTYGAANSEYQTENYSNLKIIAYGTSPYGASYGPSYFIVFYPDGTRAYYGNAGNSRGRLEWALYKREDPQGNYIQYDYLQSNELLRINTVKYGSRGSTTSPNEIKFYYKTRTRPELSYINGYTFKRTNILDKIEVKGGGQLYRKYQLSHNVTSLGYELVGSIQEYNSLNESFPAISFTYDTTYDGVLRNGNTLNIYPGIDINNDKMAVGELDGDGKMDFITYNKTSRDELNVFMDIFSDYGSGYSIGYSVSTEKFEDVFASTILSWNGKMLSQQGVTTVRETVNGSSGSVRFRTFAMASYGPVFQYDKTWNTSTYNYDYSCGSSTRKAIPKKYISGDFNGDGLTDVIAITKPYTSVNCYQTDPNCDGGPVPYKKNQISENSKEAIVPDCPCNCDSYTTNYSRVSFIDLKRDAITSFYNNIGTLIDNLGSTDDLFGVDFDSDGKTDLMHIRDGMVRVYSLTSNMNLTQIASFSNSYIDKDKPILLGDYNGDGKMDFAQPSTNNSSTWYFYLSKGNGIYYYSKNIGVTYTENYVYNGGRTVNGVYMSNPMYEYHYIAQDYNGDGKSDILKHEVVSPYSSYNVVSDRLQLYVNKFSSTDSTPSFALTTNSLATNNGLTKYGIPIFLEAKNTNSNLEYAYIDGNNVYTYEFNKDHKSDVSLKKITNDGLITDVLYERLESKYGTTTYAFDYDENYPYVNVNVAPSLKVVKESKHTGSGHVQQQLYQYKGAVFHANGLGFLGFKTVKRTNWFGTGVGELWNISKHDMQKRGAVLQEWVSTSSSDTPSSFVSKSDYTYSTQLLANKVFVNVPTQIIKEDGLQNISFTESYSYDPYQNPLSIITSFPGGSKTITYQYSNNPSVTNQYYHIGRPTKNTVVSILSGSSFTTEVEFAYNNNLVTQTKKKGNGTSWLTENFLYDAFGNITQKTLSGTGIANRVEIYTYDTSGRFMTKSTDVLGLETTFTYDTATGNPLSTTSPYGQTTTFSYDAWQRLLKETNYLGKETNFAYNKENVSGVGWCLTKLTDYPEGQDEMTYYNVFGWTVQTKKLSLNYQWIQKSFEYDAIGRQIKESEPYFSNASPTQWNQVYFDQYGRPISQSLFTGKIIDTSYNGLSVTVNDGTKTITTTKDALGNIVTLQDSGGTINYQYYANGAMKSANYGSHTVSTTIDGWGRKASLNDPSAGTYTYEYNILGEITKENTPKGSTDYIYDSFGRISNKKILGDNTDTNINYTYNSVTKLLENINGVAQGRSYAYDYFYDSYKRLNKITETNGGSANFEKQRSYDSFGRVLTDTYISSRSSVSSTVKVKNVYDTSGILSEIRDYNTNDLLWKVNDENARGQVLDIDLGNGITKTKQYDQYGFLTNITDLDNSTGGIQALKMDYNFDVQRGILNSRKNYGFSNWNENFSYDNLDRLTQITGAINHTKDYDGRGRITDNSFVGSYNYDNASTYRLDNITLNNQGDLYYQQHSLQQITYNAYKKPVDIYEEGKGRVSFEYGPMKNRTVAYYGGEQSDKYQRQYRKIYSSIMPVEIVDDTQGNSIKIITYIGGDAYTAPITYIKKSGTNPIDGYHYLHRDYLGSILAITNANGTLLEQRQFGAWGVTDKFVDSQGNTTFGYSSLINRGFTGHEHFFDVSLIHMNGRMYDAELGRFLSPDNFIQDPYNTQSFNRYGYVWNNPLSFTDPSGEIIPLLGAILVGALIGAATAAVVYTVTALITGNWSWSDFGKSILYGAVGGAISGGLSCAGNTLFSSAIANGGKGAFWQSATFNALREVASQVGTSLVFGDGITLGTITGAVAGGIVGAKIPAWSGVKGGYLKNALTEIGYEAMKGGARGAVAGGIGSLIDGKNLRDGILYGARNGAIGGAAQSAAMIATFGATTQLSEEDSKYIKAIQEKNNFKGKYVVRKGGIYQGVQSLLKYKREVTWGNSIVAFNGTAPETYGHEYGHIYQFYTQGWAKFQGKGLVEQFLDFLGLASPYFTPGYNEYNAEKMLHGVGGCSIYPGSSSTCF